MPTPKPDESKQDFMDRCVPFELNDGTAATQDQAVAICLSIWENRDKGVTDMELERAYTVLDTKDIQDTPEFVIVTGTASTPTPDRARDIVEPMGAQFKTPMPFLWMHEHEKPVGQMTFASPTSEGIPFSAQIPKVVEPGKLKDRIDEAIQSLKYKLVTAVSIGFSPIEYAFLDNGGVHFTKWEWLELSLVTIPANPDARLDLAKSIDRQVMAALGRERLQGREHLKTGVSGFRKPIQLIPRKRS